MTTQASLITGTDFIAVATQDFDRAIEFYGGVLGLPESKRWGNMRGVEFEADTLDSGVCHQAFFADPDGNALAIHHRYAPPGAPEPS